MTRDQRRAEPSDATQIGGARARAVVGRWLQRPAARRPRRDRCRASITGSSGACTCTRRVEVDRRLALRSVIRWPSRRGFSSSIASARRSPRAPGRACRCPGWSGDTPVEQRARPACPRRGSAQSAAARMVLARCLPASTRSCGRSALDAIVQNLTPSSLPPRTRFRGSGHPPRARCRADGRRTRTRIPRSGRARARPRGTAGCWCVGSTQNVFSACGACGLTVSATNTPPGRSARMRQPQEAVQLVVGDVLDHLRGEDGAERARRAAARVLGRRRPSATSCPLARQRSTIPASLSTPVAAMPALAQHVEELATAAAGVEHRRVVAQQVDVHLLPLPDPFLGAAEDVLERGVGVRRLAPRRRGSRARRRRTGPGTAPARRCAAYGRARLPAITSSPARPARAASRVASSRSSVSCSSSSGLLRAQPRLELVDRVEQLGVQLLLVGGVGPEQRAAPAGGTAGAAGPDPGGAVAVGTSPREFAGRARRAR